MNKTAVILCGGRAKRLGAISDATPKALVEVHGHPIIWYIVLKLFSEGFRHFIMPLGYKADQIQAYIDHNLSSLDARIDSVYTGEDVPIGQRISKIKHLIESECFLLINGDTIFDFPVRHVYDMHAKSENAATLASCRVYSQYGLLAINDNKVIAFERDLLVDNYGVVSTGFNQETKCFVYSGISIINKSALEIISISECDNFEREFYCKLIEMNVVDSYHIDDYWFAIDTPKDVSIINDIESKDSRAIGAYNLKLSFISKYPEFI